MDAVGRSVYLYGGNDAWAHIGRGQGERPSLRCHHEKKADEKEADEVRPLSAHLRRCQDALARVSLQSHSPTFAMVYRGPRAPPW
jgi:hypothetical protein